MGNSKYLDSLSKDDRTKLINKLYEIQNHKCFICQKEIDLTGEVNIDHIKPLANGGKDDTSNFALTHEHCNKSKQDADLEVARRLLKLGDIIKEAEGKKEVPSLKHVLNEFGGSKKDFKYHIEGDTLFYSIEKNGNISEKESEIFTDELSGEKTTFVRVPIEYLYHDELINPRGINGSISLLIKEFHKPNPQLHLSLARISDNKILIFDGQHKAVAQLMLGVRELLVRLFISPDVDRLIETNTNAGNKLKQIAFDKSIVRQLHDTLYSERIKAYQKDHSLKDDDLSFSEQNLVDYFKGERGNLKTYIINSQKNVITKNVDNKLSSYINFEGRDSKLPLSYSTFEKTFLATFINSRTILNEPLNYKAEEGLNKRILEKNQLIKLCNIIAEELLIDKYDDNIGTHNIESKISSGNGDEIPDSHLIAYRLFKEEIMYNWIQYVELLINNYFAYAGRMYDRENLFMQEIPDTLWENIRTFISNLRDLPIWKNRPASATVFGGKTNHAYWENVFRTSKAPDGTSVLVEPLNVTEMIKKAN